MMTGRRGRETATATTDKALMLRDMDFYSSNEIQKRLTVVRTVAVFVYGVW